MKNNIFSKINFFKITVAFFAVFSIIFYSAHEKIKYDDMNFILSPTQDTIGGLTERRTFNQPFSSGGDYVYRIELNAATYGKRKNRGFLTIELQDSFQQSIWKEKLNVNRIKDNSKLVLNINKKIKSGEKYTLIISDTGSDDDTCITFYTTEEPSFIGTFQDGEELINKRLAFSLFAGKDNGKEKYFFLSVLIGYIIITLIWVYNSLRISDGKKSRLYQSIQDYKKYRFLIHQLVMREFKTKYKRSVLGFLWSFLNPLLTMVIQYILFSTIFRSGINNFPVYLLSASVLFNFFTESVGNGLGSITGNVSLITKVSVPRYIYPVSRVLSSAINMLISTIPLFLAVLFTGARITKAFLNIPLIYFMLVFFCIGMSMLLATSMVYFRDTQFLWGIVSLMWMYATPIFYPETIVPEKYSFIFKINPMYYFLKVFREILITGTSPNISQYVICGICSFLFFLVGMSIFNKHQKNFALYL